MGTRTTTDAGTLVVGFFAGVATIGMFFVTITARCFVTAKLWGWYVVPFLNAPPMGMATAFGVSLLVSYTTIRLDPNDKPAEFWKGAIYAIVGAGLVLLGGWIGTGFLP